MANIKEETKYMKDIKKYSKTPSCQVKLNVFNFFNSPKTTTAIVMGGGPSVRSSFDRIKKFVQNEKCIVFSANYGHGIKTDFTYFGDFARFAAKFNEISSSSIIVSSTIVDRLNSRFWNETQKSIKCYEIYTRGKKHCSCVKKWKIKIDGSFPYSKVGPSGFACMLLPIFCRPDNIIVAGIDGPIISRRKMLRKYRFDGVIKKYGTFEKYKKRKTTLETCVIPLIQKFGIKIHCVKESAFWNVNKDKFKVDSW